MHLHLPLTLPLAAHNGGLFVSRGRGRHSERVIDSHELIVVRSGVLEMFEEAEQFRVEAGSALLLWPGRRHGGAAPYTPDLSFYWLHFSMTGGVVADAAAAAAPGLAVPRLAMAADAARLNDLCTRFLDEQETGGHGPDNAALSLLLLLILTEIARGRPEGTKPWHPLAARARECIEVQALSPYCTTSRLAAELRCNADYLGRVFRASSRHSLTDAIHAVRVRRARKLLLETLLSTKEVASECGFGDLAFFRQVFKQRTGLTPGAFRRLHGGIHVNTE